MLEILESHGVIRTVKWYLCSPNELIYDWHTHTVWKIILKDNLPHNTCQVFAKPHLRNTQMTLECQIFYEKALNKPVSFLDFWSPNRSREECMGAAIAVIPRPSLLLSLLSRDVPSELFNERRFSHCSTNTSQISTEAQAIQWLPPCMPPWERFGDRKSRKETGLF